jgi:SAM-dependent methyltransferase
LSSGSFLDAHYTAAQAVYESMLGSVGIQPGWHVLDAGCGAGSFLPLLSRLVGPGGRVSGLDLAPENVAAAERRAAAGEFACPVDLLVGNVASLQYQDGVFDAVWNANISQYLTDEQWAAALAEFRRVTRPGGLVAVKEHDLLVEQVYPAPPFLYAHLLEAARAAGDLQTLGMLRPIGFPAWFRSAGLEVVSRQCAVIEFRAPLRPPEREYIGAVLEDLGALAERLPLADDEKNIWRKLRMHDSAGSPLDHPDFCWREGHVLIVGTVRR